MKSRFSNQHALRSADLPAGRHEDRELWSTGAPEHQGARAPVDESRFYSRQTTKMVRGRIPAQEAVNFKLLCTINDIEIQDALREAIADWMEKQRRFAGALEHQSTTINDFDDLKEDDAELPLFEKRDLSKEVPSPSSNHESGAPEHQSSEFVEAEHLKAKAALEFYANKTGNRIKQRDFDSFLKVAHLPDMAIRGGVLKSIILCRQRVNSFEYCLGAIQEIAESGVGEDFIRYLESKLRMKQQGLPSASGEVKGIR